jgi:demethylmenaquinone methyltransferase/2-methoxy-6-polyprenyl-1,4-benzoquinol methylase
LSLQETKPLNTETRPKPEPQFVKNLFGDISKTYDKANDWITFGMARQWRKALVEWSDGNPKAQILDCATGTGDLAIDFKNTLPDSNVIGSDFCEGMLEYAPLKAKNKNLEIKFEVADVTQLPYANETFDIVSIAYGIRNVLDRKKAFSEMARVLKPGGRMMILETGEVNNPLLKSMIQIYFKNVVPKIGGWISGRRDAYEYLQKSSGLFPSGTQFIEELENTGLFNKIQFRSLMGGASYIYKAIK